MITCSHCCPLCDFCKYYKFNEENIDEGYCSYHDEYKDPNDVCDDFHCNDISK